ncbi:MAG: phospho-sugar mutase [Pseudonocardiaceae bacterium]|nr:phospho-sugar mutase [Pseudonocardiaceae bacterium]
MTLRPRLRDAAFRWLADELDTDDRAELQRILASAMGGDEASVAELAERMAGPLRFGTAGLRGPLRAGPNGMNRAVVVRTTAGVAEWLRNSRHAGATVIVGRDARHGSEAFCTDTASTLAAAGFDVRVLPSPLPTPVVGFAVRELGAAAGIQITASHNPLSDNGYKLFDAAGTQIAPPVGEQIEAAIAAAAPAVSVPRAHTWSRLGDEVLEAYLRRLETLPKGTHRTLRVAATALHGVGAATLREALRRNGFTDLSLVAEQADPNPDFPTVTFPNPEEPGAADQLLALASEVDADMAIALDPDADRCALGVPLPDGSWRMLRGDEAGALLGSHLLSTLDRQAHPDPLVATTIASSSILRSIAATHGVRCDLTQTGFKYLVRSGDGAGTGLVFAYEEALGLCVDPDAVRDKDGISAAVLACDLAATLNADGRTLLDALDELAIEHGVYLTDSLSPRFERTSRIAELMAELRADPPTVLAGREVSTEDMLPGADVLRIAGEGVRALIRPSGTEPKLKAYLEVVRPVAQPDELTAARAAADARLADLRADVSALLDA